jgi:putative ABC transport system permease protein
MFDIDKYKEIWQTISRNKLRSFLTGFGVAWGILLFVVIYGVGNGIQQGFKDAFSGISPNSMFVFSNLTSQEYKGLNAGRHWEMNNDDLTVLKNNISEIQYISGMVFGQWGGTVSYKDRSGEYSSKGVDANHSRIEVIYILQGRDFNLLDMQEKRKICIIGKRVYEELFEKEEDPIGKQIAVNSIYYTVVGVADGSDEVSIGGSMSESILIPLTTMQQLMNMGKEIHTLSLAAYDNVDIKTVEKKVKDILKARHTIAPTDDAAIMSFNLEEIFTMFNNLFLGIKILVWIVGMGSLFAGAVGISNIMLVSIRERTKEIGIRRALGAKPNVILRQIIGESLFLTFLAGYIGFFIGILILGVINSAMNSAEEIVTFNMQLSFGMAVLALSILVFAGMAAGIIPARYALKIKAIDAIRDE